MTGIEIISGNLLEAFDKGEVTVIAHVVNCQGKFNAGIAKQIRNKYPSVYDSYMECCNPVFSTPNELLGQTLAELVNPDNFDCPKRVYNLFAQLSYGTSKRQLNYGALGRCLGEMAEQITFFTKIGIPCGMGCGLAGGDWDIVLEMIEFYFRDRCVRIYKL